MDHAHLMAVQHGLQDLLNAMTACKHHGRPLVPAAGGGAAAEGAAGVAALRPSLPCPAPLGAPRPQAPRRGAALTHRRRGGCLGFAWKLTPMPFLTVIFKRNKFCH